MLNLENFYNAYSKVKAQKLPGLEAHKILMPISRLNELQTVDSSNFKESAVGVILFEENSKLRSVLIERSEYNGTHSKQFALPGGKLDLKDPSLEFTARRECYEEISIPIKSGKLIGPLSQVIIPVSKFIVNPFIFHHDKKPIFIPDQREVNRILEFDLDLLLDENIIERKDIYVNESYSIKNVPYFNINNNVVWGATAMILAEIRYILQQTKI